MIVWLTPSRIAGFASGSCTWRRSWRGVDRTSARPRSTSRAPANAQARQPDRRRKGEDHRRDQRRRHADAEEQDDRHQVGEGGDRLHRVEDRPERRVRPRSPARPDAERDPDRQRDQDRRGGSGQRLDARLPQPEHAHEEEPARRQDREAPARHQAGDRPRRAAINAEPRQARSASTSWSYADWIPLRSADRGS